MPTSKYLVATDLSQASRRGAQVAAQIARRSGAKIDLFCAIPSDVADDMEAFTGEVLERVNGMAKSIAGQGIAVEGHVTVTKDPVKAIVKHGKRSGAGMIVVSPQGATALKKFMLGSVTERLLRTAPSMMPADISATVAATKQKVKQLWMPLFA